MVFENLNRAIQSCRFQLACHCFFSEKVSVGAEIFAVVFFKIYKWLKKFQCALSGAGRRNRQKPLLLYKPLSATTYLQEINTVS